MPLTTSGKTDISMCGEILINPNNAIMKKKEGGHAWQ
jgi:hypothetical protein